MNMVLTIHNVIRRNSILRKHRWFQCSSHRNCPYLALSYITNCSEHTLEIFLFGFFFSLFMNHGILNAMEKNITLILIIFALYLNTSARWATTRCIFCVSPLIPESFSQSVFRTDMFPGNICRCRDFHTTLWGLLYYALTSDSKYDCL